jgi:hypothetical protein
LSWIPWAFFAHTVLADYAFLSDLMNRSSPVDVAFGTSGFRKGFGTFFNPGDAVSIERFITDAFRSEQARAAVAQTLFYIRLMCPIDLKNGGLRRAAADWRMVCDANGADTFMMEVRSGCFAYIGVLIFLCVCLLDL